MSGRRKRGKNEDAGAQPSRPQAAPPKRKSGPKSPSKMSAEAVARIIEVLEVGSTWAMAAAAGNVDITTLERWRNRDADFAAACARARDSGAIKLVETIKRAASEGDWHAAAWLLERRWPDSYARRTVVTAADGGPLKFEGELRVAGEIRSNVEASAKIHAAILAAVVAPQPSEIKALPDATHTYDS